MAGDWPNRSESVEHVMRVLSALQGYRATLAECRGCLMTFRTKMKFFLFSSRVM